MARHRGTLLASITLCLTLTVPVSMALASSLSEQLRQQAQQQAESTTWGTTDDRGNVTSHASRTGIHPLGSQTLSIEKQENKKRPEGLLVRVYQFNYDLLQARLVIVDAQTHQVTRTQQIDTVHLPLSSAEIAYASTLLSKNDSIVERLRAEQIQRGRIAFEQLAELDVKASIYEPLSDLHACHHQRCALLSLFDATRTVFTIEPVVNLQTMQVKLLDRE